ncbi:hypothetical protein W911_01810 [Hyphomicrobium nitrativorans NL23]|uniref:DUF1223 domain-containing protein n=1 Tax=Hyphomicrobium nitrativorans NL23 TaxID=1029756 RepID=V5SAF1_9HYPH|nr:hypothetical protein W911_01810 [Hyphomicrobium nitrativorans NL23]
MARVRQFLQGASVSKTVRLLRRLVIPAAGLVLLATGLVSAQQPVPTHALGAGPPRAVIELFTSQGCADCPAADALLKTFVDRDDMVALTLPVDYWDYLGWKDTLAGPRNAERQRAYVERFGTGTVFTPQAVVNGTMEVLGSDANEIDRAIRATETALSSSRIPVLFWHFGNTIIIETGGAAPEAEPREATIWLAVVQRKVDVPIKGGENAGKTLTYYNVVRELTPVGVWNGRPATIRLARAAIMRPETEDLIVLIQEAETGPILGAARLMGN